MFFNVAFLLYQTHLLRLKTVKRLAITLQGDMGLDQSDALGIALCHAHTSSSLLQINKTGAGR